MKIDVTRHCDASERNAQGYYDYFYEYDDFIFSDDTAAFFARSYTDNPTEVAFRSRLESGQVLSLTISDLDHPLFREAMEWLRASGKTELKWLDEKSGGYVGIRGLN